MYGAPVENDDGSYTKYTGHTDRGQPTFQNVFEKIRVKRSSPDAIIPVRATSGSAGYDLFALKDVLNIFPGCREMIETGISMEIPQQYYGRVAPRSGLALKSGIDVLAGVIDSDYTGDIGVILVNHGSNIFSVKKGDKIAQIIFEKKGTFELVETESLTMTQRGSAGFGSTDKSMTDKPKKDKSMTDKPKKRQT